MIYERNKLKIDSDFKIREIQKDEYNIDLIIPLEYRCVNLYFTDFPKCINSRVQFPSVKSIFIRFCIIENNSICTVHFLSDSGVYSGLANFEMDYSKTYIEVRDREFFVDMIMRNKGKTKVD